MKRLIIFCFLALITILYSCSDSDEKSVDHSPFVFGVYYDFCQGDCTHLFKYENGEVYRDELDRFDLSNITFSKEPDADILENAQSVFNTFPDELKINDADRYGCPNCADQGTIFLQLTEDGTARQWYLDTRVQDDWSRDLQDFVNVLKMELEEIIIY